MGQVFPAAVPTDAYTLAGQYLRALGWPDTPQNRRAFVAWFNSESAHTGGFADLLLLKGNNPLNITGCSNYRLVGSHKICVYQTQAEGIQAFKNLISSSNHNYPGIVQGFQANTGQSAISAIINSGWVTGGVGPSYWHTVNGVRSNLLQSAYNALPAQGGSGTGGTATGNTNVDQLATFLGHGPDTLFTAADAAKIRDTVLKGAPPGVSILWDTAIGPVINQWVNGKTTVAQAAGNLTNLPGFAWSSLTTTPATNIQDTGAAIGGLAQTIAGIGDTITKALGKGPFVIALIGAGVMGLFGIYLITKEATSEGSGQSAQSIVSPVPVFLREGA